jgi:predicted  nucleic acid-binding Zn ribbon protein
VKKGSSGKEKSILVCPKCLKPYRPDKTLTNLFGIAPFGFKCKNCGYNGAGPIKLEKK